MEGTVIDVNTVRYNLTDEEIERAAMLLEACLVAARDERKRLAYIDRIANVVIQKRNSHAGVMALFSCALMPPNALGKTIFSGITKGLRS